MVNTKRLIELNKTNIITKSQVFHFIILSVIIMVSLFSCGGCINVTPVYFPEGVKLEENENYGIANKAMENQQFETGIEYLKKASQDDYRHPFIYARLAEYTADQGKFENALAYSQRALEIFESDDIKVMYQNEMELFNKELRPKLLAQAYSLHGAILFEMSRYKESEEFIQKSQNLNPDDLKMRDYQGRLAIENGQYEKAISNFQYFVKESTKYYNAHFFLGKALLLSGKINEGKMSLQTFIKIAPKSNKYIQEAKKLVEEN